VKLPFITKLGALTSVFSRLNPKIVLGKIKGVADFKGLIAKVKSKIGLKKGDGPEDEDMFGDLGDIDALDVAATERMRGGGKPEGQEPSPEGTDDGPQDSDVSQDSRDQEDPQDDQSADDVKDTALSDLEGTPDFDGNELDQGDEEQDIRAKKKKLILIAGGGVAVSVLLGGVMWLVIGGPPAPAPVARVSQPPPGTSVFNLDALPAPQHVPAPAAVTSNPRPNSPTLTMGHEAAAVAAVAVAQPMSSDLAALGLNVAQEPGAGLVVPAMTKASFAGLVAWPPSVGLERAPIDALIEQAKVGPLPKVAADGRTPFDAYARPKPDGTTTKPGIAVIVSSLGTSRAGTDAALLALPSNVTFALNIYARGLDFWVREMRDAGHEILLEMPSESAQFPFVDPGPYALKALVTPEENVKKLDFILSRTSGYFGILAVSGSKFLTNAEQVQGLMARLKARGLMFVDGGVAGSLGPRVAYKEGLPWAAVELNLDEVEGRAALDRQLVEAESLAKKRAMTLVRVSSTPLSVARLNAWLKTLDAKGIRLVPVSALAKKQLVR